MRYAFLLLGILLSTLVMPAAHKRAPEGALSSPAASVRGPADTAKALVWPSPTPKPTPPADDTDPKGGPPKKEKRGSLILAPIPINSPTFGTGMIFAAGYVFPFKRDDKLSAPSS